MTDTSALPEMPDAAQTAHFLRRFADLMSNGANATYLLHAAVLIETLGASLTAASDEEQLWRYKYETMTAHNDMLEAECDSLKHDIDGHVNITNSILAERDTLKSALEARETEMLELSGALNHERDQLNHERGQLTAKSETHEAALAGLRASFDAERMSLAATAQARTEELDRVRRAFEHEREEFAAGIKLRDRELTGLRDELTATRADSEAEIDALKAKLAALEAKRAELRSAFDRISDLRIQTAGAAERTASSAPPRLLAAEPVLPLAPDEASTLVPKATLQQARAQFEYLAKDCTRRGDIATQVMCELGAHTLELALDAGDRVPSHVPVGEVALGILSPDSAPVAAAEQRLAAGS